MRPNKRIWLGSTLLRHTADVLDVRAENPYEQFAIPDTGYVLQQTISTSRRARSAVNASPERNFAHQFDTGGVDRLSHRSSHREASSSGIVEFGGLPERPLFRSSRDQNFVILQQRGRVPPLRPGPKLKLSGE
jgi:hypothetical protein